MTNRANLAVESPPRSTSVPDFELGVAVDAAVMRLNEVNVTVSQE